MKQTQTTLCNRQRYDSLDIAKFIAAFLVVTIHCSPFLSFNLEFDIFVSTVSRLAVPFFFCCSGFLFFNSLEYKNGKIVNCKANRAKLFKYVKRIVLMYVIWSAIYLCWLIPEWYSNGWLSLGAFIDYGIAFFRNGSYYHLWYILDLIYATLFGYLLLSLIKKRTVIVLSMLMYVCGLLTYSYYWIDYIPIDLLNRVADIFVELWNSVTRAFPLMIIGFWAGNSKRKLTFKTKIILFFVSFILLICEVLFLYYCTDNKENMSYIIFTLPCAYFLFSSILSINITINKAYLFRKVSTIIYCVHPMVINLLILIPNFNELHSTLKYIIVSLISMAIAFLIVKLSDNKLFKWVKYVY